MINEIVTYFDLQSARRRTAAEGNSAASPQAPVLPQYLVVSIGVFIEPFLRHYMDSGTWTIDWRSALSRAAFGLIVGVIILPAVYKSSFDPGKPLLVQLAALFPLGIGWQSIFASATKLLTGK